MGLEEYYNNILEELKALVQLSTLESQDSDRKRIKAIQEEMRKFASSINALTNKANMLVNNKYSTLG